MLFVGIVEEGAKLVPVLFYWWGSKRSLTPKFGLMLGAVSGAGFGIFEAINKINMNSVYRWNWSAVGVGQQWNPVECDFNNLSHRFYSIAWLRFNQT